MTKFISIDNIPQLLEELAAGAVVWAPRELAGSGASLFERWQPGQPVDLEHITSISAKDVLLPRTEKLFDFSYAFGGPGNQPANAPGGEQESAAGACTAASPCSGACGERISIEPAIPSGATVLFGARACDARALTVLDALFDQPEGEAYSDPYYHARRKALTVITLACTACDPACFCSSFKNGPAETAGSDLILYPVEAGFLAEAVTLTGEEIITRNGRITTGGEAATATSGSGQGNASPLFEESSQGKPPLAVTDVVEGLAGLQEGLPAVFKDLDFWNRMTATCISCGFCSHGCPACYCFNIHDEMRGDREGERLRSWDACMFNLYTQEASGHNPRPTQAHRYRNRVNHKFSYYPANQGEILCTGCGRCIRGCPASIDIRDVLRAALEKAATTAGSPE